MNIKAVIFDVGHTLIRYSTPLNWQALYPQAIKQMMKACGVGYTEGAEATAQNILTKYNTRINFREYEVSSDDIFSEILNAWKVTAGKIQIVKEAFYRYFQKDVSFYEDTEMTLKSLKKRGIMIGVLTDVAYGMDNEYALSDLAEIIKYIDLCLTSRDVGFRKPNVSGYKMLQKSFDLLSEEIVFVGDEEKDIIGANNAGMISALINRDNNVRNYSQHYTIKSLSEIFGILDR